MPPFCSVSINPWNKPKKNRISISLNPPALPYPTLPACLNQPHVINLLIYWYIDRYCIIYELSHIVREHGLETMYSTIKKKNLESVFRRCGRPWISGYRDGRLSTYLRRRLGTVQYIHTLGSRWVVPSPLGGYKYSMYSTSDDDLTTMIRLVDSRQIRLGHGSIRPTYLSICPSI